MKTIARTVIFTITALALVSVGGCRKPRSHDPVVELDPVQIRYQEWLKRAKRMGIEVGRDDVEREKNNL